MKLAIPGITTALLLLFGVSVLYTSIYSLNRAITTRMEEPLSAQRWYVSGPVLPDHPLYPALMARDRLVMYSTSAEDQPQLKMQYARKRLDSAKHLVEKGEVALAVSTLSKSQHYVWSAAKQARAMEYRGQSPSLLAQQVDESLYRLGTLLSEHPELRTIYLDQLIASCQTELSLIPRVASGETPADLL